MLTPSPTGYEFNSADLAQAKISDADVSRIILGATQSIAPVSPGSADGVAALLASILKTQKKNSCNYQPFPFDYAIFTKQQVLAKNPLRQYLLIQNVGSGDLLVVFEESGSTPEDFSAAANQQALINMQTRAIRIVAGGSYEPSTAPLNAITLFTLNTATNGLVIDGS